MLLTTRAFVFLTVFLPSLVCAQDSLTVKQAVEIALADSPILKSAEQRVAAAGGLRQQAGSWMNPRFLFQAENLRGGDFSFSQDADVYAFFTQPFELPGKRAARVEVAQSGYRRAELQRSLARRELVLRVKRSYWRAVAAQRARDLLQQNMEGMDSLVSYHAARVREGAMAEADLIRVQLERERIEIEYTTATLESERAMIDLLREMGSGDVRPVKLADSLESAELSPASLSIDLAMANRAEVLAAKAVLQQAMAAERLQRASARPDFDVAGGYKRTQGLNTALVGFSVNLPVFNRNQGNIAASSAEVRDAEALVAMTEATTRAEMQAAITDYNIRQRQVSTTLRMIRDHAAETSRIAQAAYREGGIDLLRLIDSERVRIDSELLYNRALAEYQQSIANLESMSGVFQ